jgi:hypothetical protein
VLLLRDVQSEQEAKAIAPEIQILASHSGIQHTTTAILMALHGAAT